MKTWSLAVWRSWQTDRDRWLLAVAALLLAATFFKPSIPVERALYEHIVAIDVTQSMNVLDQLEDGQPVSRLAAAKRALREALLRLPCGSKVGWAAFTEYRTFLLLAPVEVCANLSELRASLDRIDGRMAWSGNSEIAKGLHSGIGIAQLLPGKPSLVFVTDGQEAPPLNPRFRPKFDDKPGDVQGVIVGVGEARLSPIPKFDPSGRPLGYWRADEVMQTDIRSQGRGGSVSGEKLTDDGVAASPAAAALGATPGREHLSSLHEPYLRLLSGELGLAFLKLESPQALVAALTAPALARPVAARADLRPALAGSAMCLLLAPLLSRSGGWLRRLRRGRWAREAGR